MLKSGLRAVWLQIMAMLSFLAPGNLKAQLDKTKQKSPVEIVVNLIKGIVYGGVYGVWIVYFIVK